MAKRRIFIDRSGNIQALCDNVLENIPGLGPKHINRAADVEYNNEKHVWEIITPDGEIIGQHERRDKAIELEIKLMNEKIHGTLANV